MIVFSAKTHSAVDQVSDEIRRMRSWIQHDRRLHWEKELRHRSRVLAQAEQELLSAKMAGLLDNLSVQQLAARRAREAREEAEKKLANVKRWSRDFESAAEPLAKVLDSFREVLAHEIPRGISFLSQAQKTLADYREIHAPTAPARTDSDDKNAEAEKPSDPA